MRLTASNLASAINQLPRDREYNYINPDNTHRIMVENVISPEGPIKFRRYDPSKGETLADAKLESISANMLWRLANAISEGVPVNVDQVYNGSYNTRAVLESLLAHSPQFYFCNPGRVQFINGRSEAKDGHKHIVFMPNKPHSNGLLCKTDIAYVSTITHETAQAGIDLNNYKPVKTMTIEQKREHAGIQIALVLIGK